MALNTENENNGNKSTKFLCQMISGTSDFTRLHKHEILFLAKNKLKLGESDIV